MKKTTWVVLVAVFGILAVILGPKEAGAIILIDDVSDEFTVGDFKVNGNNVHSGTGQNYEVLKFSPLGNASTGTAFDGSDQGATYEKDQAPHGDVDLGDLWSHLDVNGITSTTKLVFGFDVNQNDCENDGSAAADCVDITDLQVTVDALVFTLGGETVRVLEINGEGSSVAEARFEIQLGYDFMTTYNAASTGNFKIQATHDGANAGFEEYFLSSAFLTDGPVVPEPATLLLMGPALAGAFLNRRRRSRS